MSGKIIARVRERERLRLQRSLTVAEAPYRTPPPIDPYRDLGRLSGYGGYRPDPPVPRSMLDPISRFFARVFRL